MASLPSYRPLARALHWIVAAIVIGMFVAGTIMVQPGLERSLQNTLFLLHKNTGLLVLVLILWRLAYRATNPPPPLPASVPPLQRRIAGMTHALLYLVIIVMAVSGYVRVVAGGFPLEGPDALGIPRLVAVSKSVAETAHSVHFLTHYAVFLLVILHVGAALYHAVIKRDGVFSRMWPGLGR